MASDVGSGALMANAGAISAAYNVRINLKSINDLKFCSKTNIELEHLLEECKTFIEKISTTVEETF